MRTPLVSVRASGVRALLDVLAQSMADLEAAMKVAYETAFVETADDAGLVLTAEIASDDD